MRTLRFAILATALAATSLQAETVPTGFGFELAVGAPFGGEPIGFTWLPDGRMLIIERGTGNVRVAAVGATTSIVIATIPNLMIGDERGLLGIAIDPDWPGRPYVYFSFTRNDGRSILSMYTASGALSNPSSTSLTLASPFVLVEMLDGAGNHNGGTVRFGLDGMLYASFGEDALPCTSQDLTELRGKVLRLDISSMPGAGSGPPPKADVTPADNPFVANPNENARLVFAWGLRNPFRFTFDSLTGDLFVGDAGSNTWEEINRMSASSGGGQNFGWPILEGPDSTGFGFTCGLANVHTGPIHVYPNPPKSNAAVVGGPLYRTVPASPMSFPASYNGSYFLYDWGGRWIQRIVQGANGWEIAPQVPGQVSPDYWGEGFVFYSDFQEGPDGALYLMKHGGSWGVYRIRRVLPTSADGIDEAAHTLEVEARPNPARAGNGVDFVWSAPRSGFVQLRLFDAAGRLVARLGNEAPALGGVVRWGGRDTDGRSVSAGVYFYRFEGADASASGRVTLYR